MLSSTKPLTFPTSPPFLPEMLKKSMDWKKEILAAEQRIRPQVRETPLELSHYLSQAGGAEVYLKLEHL